MKLYGKETNQPTNPTSFSFFFFGVIRGRTPLYREKGRWVRPLLGVGMGGVYRRTFFFVSFRKPLAKATREGKGGGDFCKKQVRTLFFLLPLRHIFPLVILHSSFSRQGIFGHFFGSHYCLAFSFFFFTFFFFRLTRFFGDGIEIELCEGGLVVIPIVFLTIGRVNSYSRLLLFFKLSNCSLPFFFYLFVDTSWLWKLVYRYKQNKTTQTTDNSKDTGIKKNHDSIA